MRADASQYSPLPRAFFARPGPIDNDTVRFAPTLRSQLDRQRRDRRNDACSMPRRRPFIDSTKERPMPDHAEHVKILDKKITELSDALAHLGKGTDLKELLRIIRFPGYTTPAEFAFTLAMLDGIARQVEVINRMSKDLVSGANVVVKEAAHA